MKQVELLKEGRLGKVGEVVEVSDEDFQELTREREYHDGKGLVKWRVAKPADEKAPDLPTEALTAGELAAQGKRNVVETPPDPGVPQGTTPDEGDSPTPPETPPEAETPSGNPPLVSSEPAKAEAPPAKGKPKNR